MAYNEKLAERIRNELGEIPFVEKKMFGGMGILDDGMIVRASADDYESFLPEG